MHPYKRTWPLWTNLASPRKQTSSSPTQSLHSPMQGRMQHADLAARSEVVPTDRCGVYGLPPQRKRVLLLCACVTVGAAGVPTAGSSMAQVRCRIGIPADRNEVLFFLSNLQTYKGQVSADRRTSNLNLTQYKLSAFEIFFQDTYSHFKTVHTAIASKKWRKQCGHWTF
jgi:hypothetical protein